MVKKMRCYSLLDEQQKKQVNKEFRHCVADLIVSAREKSGFTSRDLAFLSGIDPSNLCRIEKGKQGISVSILFRLLYCLGYDSIGIKM